MWALTNPSRASGARAASSGAISRNIAAIVLGAILLTVAALYWAAKQSDQVSIEQQALAAQHAIEMSIDELALQQETVAVWDDAASNLVRARRDMTWIHDNTGSWLHRIFDHDEAFLLDGADRPFYAAREGERVATSRYRRLAGELAPFVKQLRATSPQFVGRHDRLPGIFRSDNSVRTTPRATHVSRITSLGGRPAAVSAMLVKPATDGYVRPDGRWPILISARYLDGEFLEHLSARQMISAPRFSSGPETAAGEHAIPIASESNRKVGYLIWEPALPGTTVVWNLLLPTLFALSILISFILILGRRLRRTVDELAEAEHQAVRLALRDPLTELPNRAYFQQKLDEARLRGAGSGGRFALALVDLDEFKLVNDTMGHDAGDALLKLLAKRLKSAVRECDFIARLGGDEFAIIFGSVADRKELNRLCERLVAHLNAPWEYHDKSQDCQISIGAAMADLGDCADDVLKEADLALYQCKAAGRGAYRIYQPSMWKSVLERQQMLLASKEALASDSIRPFYQPKVDLSSGELVGFEALLRLCAPGKDVLGPSHIEAAFEDAALAVQISTRMVELVLDDVREWRAQGMDFGHVAINAGAAELRSRDFATNLLRSLKKRDLPPESIQIEVTESVLLGRGTEHVGRLFRLLARNGIKLALDDFGTGFASLTHLKQFPIDVIKIDRRFVRNLQVDPEDGAIVGAIVGLASALRLDVVAEGIETSGQRDFLAALGCRTGQGYLFGPAVPSAEVPRLLDAAKAGRRAA